MKIQEVSPLSTRLGSLDSFSRGQENLKRLTLEADRYRCLQKMRDFLRDQVMECDDVRGGMDAETVKQGWQILRESEGF